MSRKRSARIAVMFLILHGLIEIAGLFLMSFIPHTLVSFGGLTGSLLEQNTQAVGLLGAVWGISRLVAAWGVWSLRKWAMLLSIILCVVTIVIAVSIIPPGVVDTFLAMPALVLLLYAWFGNEVKVPV